MEQYGYFESLMARRETLIMACIRDKNEPDKMLCHKSSLEHYNRELSKLTGISFEELVQDTENEMKRLSKKVKSNHCHKASLIQSLMIAGVYQWDDKIMNK